MTMYFQDVPATRPGVLAPRSGEFSGIRRMLVALICLASIAACGKARLGDPEPGLFEPDTSPDASPGFVDASPTPVDASPTDASPPLPLPDAQLPDASPEATCADLYGMAPSYQLCSETVDTCSFNAHTNGGNCQQMCAQYGGVCVVAYDNNSPDFCVSEGADTCLTNRDTEICVCSRP